MKNRLKLKALVVAIRNANKTFKSTNVMEVEKTEKTKLLDQVMELAWKRKWTIVKLLWRVYREWDVIEPHLTTVLEFVRTLI